MAGVAVEDGPGVHQRNLRRELILAITGMPNRVRGNPAAWLPSVNAIRYIVFGRITHASGPGVVTAASIAPRSAAICAAVVPVVVTSVLPFRIDAGLRPADAATDGSSS